MNEFQTQLYSDLMELVEQSEAFYYKDFYLDNKIYRIFNYRLCSYTEFLMAGGMECRGTTFEVSDDTRGALALRLASLPFEKFFNLYENPMTMDLDLSTVVEIADKADGSLITTFTHPASWFEDNEGDCDLFVKSKGSLESDQAKDALRFLHRTDNIRFYRELIGAERLGYTVIMEYVAPHNRIVLGYENEELRVLGVRSREDGSYVYYDEIDSDVFPEIAKRWTKLFDVENPKTFIDSIPDMKDDIEGFVVRMEDGQRVKIKTLKYLALHHTKDSINSPRRLFEAVLEEATDDMRTLFHDDKLAIKMIEEMEEFVDHHYNHMVDTVERFFERNRNLDRKEYAILGQQSLDRSFFGLAMTKYLGKSVDYKSHMKKNWKSYGLRDREENEN